MGEANRRGTFEQRKFMAKQGKLKKGLAAMSRARAAEAEMTPRQRDSRSRVRAMFSWMLGLVSMKY